MVSSTAISDNDDVISVEQRTCFVSQMFFDATFRPTKTATCRYPYVDQATAVPIRVREAEPSRTPVH